ncbi:hypothetical protein [Erythrobacter sp. MTPC3]|uniref:hypothetical protein n=1 Tax=Erythrobacter sp. MTPC3 TaxID=3056564 RepID=UPI0036F31DF5
MIDYLALTIGHALMAFAFWQLFGRERVDTDPLIEGIKEANTKTRKQLRGAGRRQSRAKAEES